MFPFWLQKNFSIGSRPLIVVSALFALTFSLIGCGGGTGVVQTSAPAVLTVTPPNVQLNTGGAQQFTALLGGMPAAANVQWSVSGIAGGNKSVGTISGTGMYTAPSSVPPGGVVQVAAVNSQSGTQSASASISITTSKIQVSVSPVAVTVLLGQTQQFTSQVSGSGDQIVSWSVNGVANGNSIIGEISSSGMYTAPTNISQNETVTITAQSEIDPTGKGMASAFITSGQGGNAGCGPPDYSCARIDLSISSIPERLPNWGGPTGSNSQFTDAIFNPTTPVQYVRVTDTHSFSSHPNRSFVVDDGGSGDENHFNADETLFTIGDTGGNTYFFGFDPATMATGLVWGNPNGAATVGTFSQTNPNLYYSFPADGKIESFDFAGCRLGQACPPAHAVMLFDFAAECGVNGVLQWHAIGGVGSSDKIFAASYSPGTQNSASQVVAWNKSTGFCYLYDAAAGTVTQYPGSISLGSVTTPDRYTVHNVKLDPSGTWLVVIAGNCIVGSCQAHAWKIGTTTVKACAISCGGHFTETTEGWLNTDNRPGDVYLQTQILFRSWDNFDTTNNGDLTPLVAERPAIPLTWGTHPSAKNDILGDQRLPVFNCIYSPDASMSFPWQSEIVAYSQSNGEMYRFGHSFNSNFESVFQSEYCIGAASSKGNFYAFPSDGEGTFGSTQDGGVDCLLGGPPPMSSHDYALHNLITVTTGLAPVFEVTTAGTSGTVSPSWPSGTGNSVTWGSATFTNRGQTTCRSDVIIMRAQ
jgi:hypothetical protein